MMQASYLIVRLDKEFTNELVDRTDSKAEVPQMLSVDPQLGISINNYGYGCLNRILLQPVGKQDIPRNSMILYYVKAINNKDNTYICRNHPATDTITTNE